MLENILIVLAVVVIGIFVVFGIVKFLLPRAEFITYANAYAFKLIGAGIIFVLVGFGMHASRGPFEQPVGSVGVPVDTVVVAFTSPMEVITSSGDSANITDTDSLPEVGGNVRLYCHEGICYFNDETLVVTHHYPERLEGWVPFSIAIPLIFVGFLAHIVEDVGQNWEEARRRHLASKSFTE